MQNMHQEDDLSPPFVAPFTWDDDDWKLWNAMVAFRDQAPAVAPRLEAATAGDNASEPSGLIPITQPVASAATAICLDIASIPPGRQAAAVLQCGMCMKPRLYHRKADLKRHMETHLPATHFCRVNNCPRGPGNGFTRIDKLNEHLTNMHGLQRSSSSNH